MSTRQHKRMVKSIVILLILIIIFALSTGPILAQIDWLRYAFNPVLDMGSTGSWDAADIRSSRMILDGDTLKMWYTGVNTQFVGRIGYASSLDGINWTKHPDPVLDIGPAGSFDDGWVLCGFVIKEGDTLKMWYQGWAGGYHENRIGYATSVDGITWTKYAGNPVLDHGAPGTWNSVGVFFPSVIFDGTTYHMWYGGCDENDDFRIGYATSLDGIDWNEHPNNPVLEGIAGSWEKDVKDHIVIFDGTTFHMWYTGAHGYPYYRIGYATSPDGVNWTKADSENPVLDLVKVAWEQDGVETGGVLFDGITYKMWYSGYDGAHWRFGYAVSSLVVDSVKVNRRYAAPGIDSVLVTTKLKDPTGITLFAKIEAPDQTPVDSMELFDDGNHNDGNAGDSLYANLWPVLAVEERLYYVDLDVTRIDADTVVNHFNNMAIFTTIGPVLPAKSGAIIIGKYTERSRLQQFKLILENFGYSVIAENVLAEVSCTDKRVMQIGISKANFNDIPAGKADTSENVLTFNFALGYCPDSTINNPLQFDLTVFSDGYAFWTSTFDFTADTTATAIEENFDIVPNEFALHQNHPNPFNPKTMIKYKIAKHAHVVLKVINSLGQEVRTLVNEEKPAGFYEAVWDGRDHFGQQVASGLYLYRLEANNFIQTRKMVLLR
jgi:predicted GH43/DUF377 family glycosyl hydrolase